MIEGVMLKQATKAGSVFLKVGGGGGLFIPNIKNQKRKSAGERRFIADTHGRQSGNMQIGGGRNEKIQSKEIDTERMLETYGIL